MSLYVAVGTAPTVDTAVVVGPFHTHRRALEAAGEIATLGFVTEVCECQSVSDLAPQDWSEQ